MANGNFPDVDSGGDASRKAFEKIADSATAGGLGQKHAGYLVNKDQTPQCPQGNTEDPDYKKGRPI